MKESTLKYCAYDKSRLCAEECSARTKVKLPDKYRDRGKAFRCGRGGFTIWVIYKDIKSG